MVKRRGGGEEGGVLRVAGLGELPFVRSARRRRLVLTARPFAGVRVAAPLAVCRDEVADFVGRRAAWVDGQRQRLALLEAKALALCSKLGPVDGQAARRLLPARLRELAARHGFQVGRVTVRNQRCRWGSCSARNDISLNAKLLLLPDELRDFVLLHELVHTRVKNHGPAFWAELLAVLPEARLLHQRMQDYGPLLLVPPSLAAGA